MLVSPEPTFVPANASGYDQAMAADMAEAASATELRRRGFLYWFVAGVVGYAVATLGFRLLLPVWPLSSAVALLTCVVLYATVFPLERWYFARRRRAAQQR